MSIRRVVPDITSECMDDSRAFYSDFLGLNLAMDMGWIQTYVSKNGISVRRKTVCSIFRRTETPQLYNESSP